MSAPVKGDTFEDIVSGVEVVCEHTDGCQNKANWCVRYHECGQYLLCDPHVKRWVKETHYALQENKILMCYSCQKKFTSIRDVCKVTPL